MESMCPLTQRCGTYIKGNATQPLKKKKNAMCSKMDARRDYYTKLKRKTNAV